MNKTISNKPITIQVAKLITIIIFVASISYVYAERQWEIDQIITIHEERIKNIENSKWIIEEQEYSTRISLLEEKMWTQQQYLYNFKSEIKAEVKEVNWKIDQIISILLKN